MEIFSRKKNLMLCLLLCVSMKSAAQNNPSPVYIGLLSGYGATSWNNLVPKDVNDALSTSVPINVSSNHTVWGIYTGYYFLPEFALELSYIHYPNAKLKFDEMSLFTFNHNGLTELNTRSSRLALMAKFILKIPCTSFQAYSSVGAAEIRRDDAIVTRNRLTPAFGVGLDYYFNPHFIAGLNAEYIAGYGESELDPAEHYMPFLYSISLRVAYRI